MKKIVFLFLFLTVLSGCKKNEPDYTDQFMVEEIYEIYLQNDRIQKYFLYIHDTLQKQVTYSYTDSTAIILNLNPAGQLLSRTIYILGEDGLAASGTDSTFMTTGSISRCQFEYTEGFWTKKTLHWQSISNPSDSGSMMYTRIIENGNVISQSQSIGGCTNYYSYSGMQNKLDVFDFSSGITGKTSRNLVEHISWRNGCPSGPSMSLPDSDYGYELDNDGRVVKMTETYTPSYHTPVSDEVVRKVYTSRFEYILVP